MEKLFIDVRCDHRADGTFRPRKILWPDGRTWDIKRTLHVAEPVEDEFEGIRYTVLIGSAENTSIGSAQSGMCIRSTWRWTPVEQLHFKS